MSQDKAKQDEGLPLVQRSFDLCVELYTHVNRFPRAHKPLLGRDILSAAQQMFVGLVKGSNLLLFVKQVSQKKRIYQITVKC
ncbi:MAG: hypothetical protein HY036_09170 [Nitrospirae bacterium]|nr:hypothetical protein [Nitrospirota bacterium]